MRCPNSPLGFFKFIKFKKSNLIFYIFTVIRGLLVYAEHSDDSGTTVVFVVFQELVIL